MRRSSTGRHVTSSVGGEEVRAFVPDRLPPRPPLALDHDLNHRLGQAHLALGRLDGVSAILPDTHLFLYAYVRKEAVLSSQIEGTQSSLFDLLLFELDETPGVPFDDVVEVSNCVAAREHGLARLREGLPLSNMLIREVHAILLSRGRGQSRQPGEFRRSQNWIGGDRPATAHFVPPPPERVEDAMADLERFLHDQPSHTPTLLKAALAHVQFESIHPFLDGNGRVGRLLVPMLLCIEGILREPLLYLSLYLMQNRAQYYERLDRVRVQDAGRIAGSALQVHHALRSRPINTVAKLAASTGLSVPTVGNCLVALTELGLVRELTGRKRGRVFCYQRYLDVLQQGMEPL